MRYIRLGYLYPINYGGFPSKIVLNNVKYLYRKS